MTEKEIQQIWEIIVSNYNEHLANKNVKLPALMAKSDYTKNALVLIRLAKSYPNTNVVSKDELTKFIQQFYPNNGDVQQARHLAMQSGWNILSSTRGDILPDEEFPKGSYKLVDLESIYSGFVPRRRDGFSGDWEEIKKRYNYRCILCGSKEGEGHLFREKVRVELQKGHMNPVLPLSEENIIPQCQICNRADKDYWVYDKTGRVIEVADTKGGFRVVAKFLKNASGETRNEFYEAVKKLLKK